MDMSTVVVLPAVTVASRTVVRKPVISARTSYTPGSNAGALKIPEALAVALREAPVALLVMVTAALAITAPEASDTVPVMMPVGLWPYRAAASADTNRRAVRVLDIWNVLLEAN